MAVFLSIFIFLATAFLGQAKNLSYFEKGLESLKMKDSGRLFYLLFAQNVLC